jgi:hypothetical protein
MKKRVVFWVLFLVGLVFFACEFNMPAAIEIIGTPKVRFAEKVDMGKMYTDLLDNAINSYDKMDIFPCKQTDYLTYLIHMDLFDKEFETIEDASEIGNLDFPGMELLPDDIGSDLHDDKILINGSDERMTLPLSEIGSLLTGFEFSGYKTKLYFSGSSLISKSKIDIKLEEVEIIDGIETYNEIADDTNERTGVSIRDGSVNIEDWKDGYNGKECPSGGVEIPIPVTDKDIAVSFLVYIPAGETLFLNDLEAGNIKVEIVVWLPFEFTAGDDGAEIAFPDDALFSSKDDLFGRKNPDDDNIIQSLSLIIVFDKDPFKNSELIIWSGNIEIITPLTDNSFPFVISEENMKEINNMDNWPFTPNFKMKFSPGAILQFPREFNATEFTFEAKIKYKIPINLGEEG